GVEVSRSEAKDLLAYIIDISATLGAVLRAFCPGPLPGEGRGGVEAGAEAGAGDAGGGGRAGGWGPDLSGPLALRVQGNAGRVSADGFAAALALTFEATLPGLRELLGAGEVRDDGGRVRGARQWLLRCLHSLLSPVFLQPLGLLMHMGGGSWASSSFNGAHGDGDGSGDGSGGVLADGLFQFLTSLSAAAEELAPPGQSGTLLGEYNARFQLADAIMAWAGARNSLDAERTSYLADLLRELPSIPPLEGGD
ncbi:unnamed protein product, partial [Discosporangium mesarthrocarpum]